MLATLALSLALSLQAPCPQRIDVVAPSAASTGAQLSLLECGRTVLGPWSAHVGFHGLSASHKEGDGTTPLGTFHIGPTAYGIDPNPGSKLPYHRLRCGDWWDEDPTSPTYNLFQHVTCGTTPPFGGSSEALWRSPNTYRELLFVEYNAHPAVPGKGSAIFLHDSDGNATTGCISIPRADLIRVLRRLRPGATITIRLA
jgi:L,D-peptidoglycan transpeptidase YkuD (ErfK/YbiS/YcfS/YnhG family)